MDTNRGARRSAREWSDDDLRNAVAAQHSWRGVARALGLLPSSTNNLRRHARRLSLDTSHFSGKRVWSDERLRRAVARSATWLEVLDYLGIQDSSTARVRAKGHAYRLGLEVSHLQVASPRPSAEGSFPLAPQLDMLRSAATAIATAWFMLRSYATATAPEGTVYDLLVAMPAGFRRVQVKSTTCRSGTGRWLVGVGRRPYTP